MEHERKLLIGHPVHEEALFIVLYICVLLSSCHPSLEQQHVLTEKHCKVYNILCHFEPFEITSCEQLHILASVTYLFNSSSSGLSFRVV